LAKLNNIPLLLVLGALPLALLGGGCAGDLPSPSGVCAIDAAVACGVVVGGSAQELGLVGYSCTGAVRPDENARYYDEVPQGPVCADRGAGADGKQTFCCTNPADPTNCAYDPRNSCDPLTFGFQCRGSSRPDVFNAALACGQGLRDGDYVNYCCTGQTPPPKCTEVGSAFGCDDKFNGFNCPAGVLPKGSDLVQSESHADNALFLCPTATPASATSTRQNYCCYMAAPPPVDYSCVQDTTVPGCAPGRFGFACTGVDTPPEDYPPMVCPDPGVSGRSTEGYPATLYCCDFVT
jgi:hypothetical protein